jgi:ribosomal protein S18 acetylase RimI-like enzyme
MSQASEEERKAFQLRWPDVLRSRFGWTETGPSNDKATLYILESDEGVYAGHLWISEPEDFFSASKSLLINTVAIASEFRGRGWGRVLMEYAIQEARKRGLSAVKLGVAADNVTAFKLYESLGFATTRLAMTRLVAPE